MASELGNRIKKRRIELKMSQDELAHHLGYKCRSAVTKIENGDMNLKQSKIMALADALDTTPGYIMGWDEAPEPVYDPFAYEGSVELLEIYNSLTPEDRIFLLNSAKMLLNTRISQNKN